MKERMMCVVAMSLAAVMMLSACGGGLGGGNKEESSTETKTESGDGGKVLEIDFADMPQTLNPHTTSDKYELLSAIPVLDLAYKKLRGFKV